MLPIGGLREKLLAALRCGVETVLIPHRNRDSLYEVPDSVKSRLDIRFMHDADEVLVNALTQPASGHEAVFPLKEPEGVRPIIRH